MRDKGGEHPGVGRHKALAELAERQHGVVSIRQLTGPLGYSKAAVHRAVTAGRLHQLYRGVFAVGHAKLSLHAQCLAAVLACAPNALLSHVSAAWLWDLTKTPRTLLDLAATVRFEWLEKMVERSEDLELFDLRAVEGLLERAVGHQGHGRLRRAIALYRPSSFTRSSLEKRFLELCLEARLQQPRTNFVVHGFELDCYWPEHHFAVELDV